MCKQRMTIVDVYAHETPDDIDRKLMAAFNALHPGDEVDRVNGEFVRRDEREALRKAGMLTPRDVSTRGKWRTEDA